MLKTEECMQNALDLRRELGLMLGDLLPLAILGLETGPLFINMDRASKRGRLTATSVWRITTKYGLGHPHGLRHTAITQALDITGGDIRAVQCFSRHKDPRTLILYDDNRTDLGGKVARRVAASFSAF